MDKVGRRDYFNDRNRKEFSITSCDNYFEEKWITLLGKLGRYVIVNIVL